MAAKSLEVHLLGGLEVRRGGAPAPLPPSKKTRALLAYLAATGRAHSREHLCGMFWDGPDDPRAALRWSLSKLRPLVDDDAVARLGAGGDRIGFDAAGAWVDWTWLRAIDATSPRPELERAAELACRELCDGLELADCTGFAAWLAAEREALRRARRRLLAAAVASADGDAAVAWAMRWVAAEPLEEPAQLAAMRALAEAGRADDALAQYQRHAEALARETGARPSMEIERARMALTPVRPERRAGGPEAPRPAARGPLIGRDRELAAITTWWSSATPVLALTGEPGIGKSSLLGAAAACAHADGARVLTAKPFELEHVRPFGVWRDLLASLAPGDVPAALAPALAALGPSAAAPDRVDAAALDAAVVALVRHLAAAGPLLLVVDDLQWCDERSAAALLGAVRDAPGLRVALAARPGELADNAAASRAWQVLARQRLLTDVPVAPLAADDCAALVARVAPAADAHALAAAAGGNPLYALEAARAGGDAGASFDAIVAERTGRLGAPARELFAWAAAAGRRFLPSWLGRAAELPASALAQQLAELEAHGLVRAADGDDYAIAHDLVRAAAYRVLSAPRRRLVHARLAQALDELGGDPAAVAHHAAAADLHALAARACTAAAAAAHRVAAFADARVAIARGLEHAARLGDRERIASSIALCAVDAFCAESAALYEVERVLAALVTEALAAGLDDAAAAGGHAYACILHQKGDYDGAAAATLAAAERTRASETDAELFSLANGAMCNLQVQRDVPRARAMLADAHVLARARRTSLCDLELGDGLLARIDAAATAAAQLDRAAARARAEQDVWREYLALVDRIGLALEAGAYAEARAIAERARPVAERLPGGSEAAQIVALAAVARFGIDPAAVAAVDRALDTLRALDARRAVGAAQAAAAEIDLAAGRAAAARARADEAWHAACLVDLQVDAAVAGALRVRAAMAAGDPAAARETLAAVTAAYPDPPPRAAAALARARDSTLASTPAPTPPSQHRS